MEFALAILGNVANVGNNRIDSLANEHQRTLAKDIAAARVLATLATGCQASNPTR